MLIFIGFAILFLILLFILGKSFNKKKIIQSYSVQNFMQLENNDEENSKKESMVEKVNEFFEEHKEDSHNESDGDDVGDE
ncbi:MAG TPA: hypothetical protein VEY70_16295 [Metabacillus sp.]|nr:hypothetical protein [Metabacillus sp.]